MTRGSGERTKQGLSVLSIGFLVSSLFSPALTVTSDIPVVFIVPCEVYEAGAPFRSSH